MKSREIMLVVLVVAVALGSGLIGLYLGRSSAQQAAMTTGTTIGGQAVGAGSTRLYSDPQKSNLAYEVDANGRVYMGTVQQGQTILYFDGETIFRGPNSSGEKLFTVGGDTLFVGGNTNGPAAYTIKDGNVYEGSGTQGAILFTIEGDRLFQGANTQGDIVFQANKDLAGDILFVLPVLADQRF